MKGLAGAGGREASNKSNPSWDSGGSIALLLSIIYIWRVAAVGHVRASLDGHPRNEQSQITQAIKNTNVPVA